MTSGYKESLDSYWQDVTLRPGAAFWDSTSDHAVKRELPWFSGAFDPRLPVIDVGCGNGRQTRGLTDVFPLPGQLRCLDPGDARARMDPLRP
jgi:ubiquinone/menaquinone biosynthesis C-methylase UbiE